MSTPLGRRCCFHEESAVPAVQLHGLGVCYSHSRWDTTSYHEVIIPLSSRSVSVWSNLPSKK